MIVWVNFERKKNYIYIFKEIYLDLKIDCL